MDTNDGRIQALMRDAARAWQLFVDPAVPALYKAIPALALLYVLSPIDLVPDVMVGPGQLDDLAVLLIGLRVFLDLAGRQRDRAAAGRPPPADSVTTTYRVADDD